MEKRDQQEKANLEAFLTHFQNYPPPIPDTVIRHILSENGMNTDDILVIHTMNVACQKFISDVLQHTTDIANARVKDEKSNNKKKKIDLQVCDLKKALETYDIHVNRPEFIVSIPKETKEKKARQEEMDQEEDSDE